MRIAIVVLCLFLSGCIGRYEYLLKKEELLLKKEELELKRIETGTQKEKLEILKNEIKNPLY